MCYHISTRLETQVIRAKKEGKLKDIAEIRRELEQRTNLPLYHASGFSHPKLLIYTNFSPTYPVVSQWGLVPLWAKSKEDIWNRTLNASGETLFSKSAFKSAARDQRCIIYVDGFFEHHHYNDATYPFFISRKDGMPLALAGLWNEWESRETGELVNTFTIVTTEGNSLMASIHNNPSISGPRMPLILDEAGEDQWLKNYNNLIVENAVTGLVEPYPQRNLQAHTVQKLSGTYALGNVPEVTKVFEYDDVQVEY